MVASVGPVDEERHSHVRPPLAQVVAAKADAVIVERVGTWSAKGSWSLEVIAKTTKDESFRAVYSWR